MGAPEHDQSLDDLTAPSTPTFGPPAPSDDSTFDDEHDLPEPLSEQETAFLDQSLSLLDQEYDYQRQLIDHYSRPRPQTTNLGYLPHPNSHPDDADHIGQYLGSSRFEPNGSRKGNTRPPPRIYTGMDDGATIEKGHSASNHNSYAYHYSQRRPLTDLIQNAWRTSASPQDSSPLSATAPSFSQIVSAPRFRRYLTIVMLFVLLPWTGWRWYAKPRWEDRKILDNALNKQLGKGAAWYGLNVRPAFRDMVQLQTWDASLLTREEATKRLMFIGDVHGCYDERKL